MTSVNLLPCPFCGDDVHLNFTEQFGGYVSCLTVGCAGNGHQGQHDRDKIIAGWNRRAAVDDLEAARKDGELWQAIQRAAKDLAPGWEIVIGVEQYAAWIDVTDWDGNPHEFSPDNTFAETIDAAIYQSRGREVDDA